MKLGEEVYLVYDHDVEHIYNGVFTINIDLVHGFISEIRQTLEGTSYWVSSEDSVKKYKADDFQIFKQEKEALEYLKKLIVSCYTKAN